MTDRDALASYRLREAEETLADAEKMLVAQVSARSVLNRAYYVTFYAVLGLFNRYATPHQTSRHATVLGIFDREFVRTGKIAAQHSRTIHWLFDTRQIADYKDLATFTRDDAVMAVDQAREFLAAIQQYCNTFGDRGLN